MEDNIETFLAGWKPRGIRFEPPDQAELQSFAVKACKFPYWLPPSLAAETPGKVFISSRYVWAERIRYTHRTLVSSAMRDAILQMHRGVVARPEDINGLLLKPEQEMYNHLILLKDQFDLTQQDMKVAGQLLCFRERYFIARLFFNALKGVSND